MELVNISICDEFNLLGEIMETKTKQDAIAEILKIMSDYKIEFSHIGKTKKRKTKKKEKITK